MCCLEKKRKTGGKGRASLDQEGSVGAGAGGKGPAKTCQTIGEESVGH